MLQAVETRDIFNGVGSVAPLSRVEDHRLLESWSSCLLQVLLARRTLLLKKQRWGLVEGSESGTDVGWVVDATSPPQAVQSKGGKDSQSLPASRTRESWVL